MSRIHINIGPVCNNNCIFCMEEDRTGRRQVNGALTPQRVRAILQSNQGAEEACFTSGEPTLVGALPRYIRWARKLGYGRVSLMTNGRRLAYAGYCQRLIDAGLGRFYISIHGHHAKLHNGLARTPGAFEQSLAGLQNVAKYQRQGEAVLHTSTVVNQRNVGHLLEIYRLLRGEGAQQVVFNVMQATGRAHTHFEALFPSYSHIAAAFGEFLGELGQTRPPVFLVDIPWCVTEGIIPCFNRGRLEPYVHYEVGADGLYRGARPSPHRRMMDSDTVEISRQDHDLWQRSKQEACARCIHAAICPGVWKNYLERHGWDEFRPVTASYRA